MLQSEFGSGGTDLPPEVEERAQQEKAAAPATMYEQRFSILTGRAGTGKTCVLKVFLKGLEELEGKRPFYCCCPDRQGSVRLMDRTNATTAASETHTPIHQFLMRHEWLNPENFALALRAGPARAPTVIIDEASMIPMDLLGVLVPGAGLERSICGLSWSATQPVAAHRPRSPVCGHHRLAGSRQANGSDVAVWHG